MRKFLAFIFLLIFLGASAFFILKSPSNLKEVKLLIVEKYGDWKGNITQYLLTVVSPGVSITPELEEELKKRLLSLPWVHRVQLKPEADKLVVKVWEERPSFYLVFGGVPYVVGENWFILDKGFKFPSLPTYYYVGNTSPFSLENGFLRINKLVKMKINLAEREKRGLEVGEERPKISITDTGFILTYRKNKVVVYLGNNPKLWGNFRTFLKEVGKPLPGIYDFRFYDMLVRGGK